MSASLIGRFRSSAFRLSTSTVSIDTCSQSANGPPNCIHHTYSSKHDKGLSFYGLVSTKEIQREIHSTKDDRGNDYPK